jgi:glycerol uptake facilitator protein
MHHLAEFMGTLTLVALNNGVVANVLLKRTKGRTDHAWMLISVAAGLAVTFGILVAMVHSGAHINPAVSMTMFVLGRLTFLDLIGHVVAQLLGGMSGALLVYLAYKRHYDDTLDPDRRLATFATSPAISDARWNLFTEMAATFLLVGVVVVVTSDQSTIPAELVPVVIGLLVMVLGISFGGSTGFAMNPARDLGPRITHALLRLGPSNWSYAWIPVVGPILGGVLGGIVFTLYLGGF